MRNRVVSAVRRHGLLPLLLAAALWRSGGAVADEPKPEGPKPEGPTRGAPDAPKPEVPAEGEKPSELLKQTVELLDAGKKPFERVRYAPKAGSEWDVHLSVNMVYEVEIGGQVQQKADSTTTLDATQRIDAVSPKGESKVTLTVRKFRSATTGTGTTIAEGTDGVLNDNYALLEGRAVHLVYDARGIVLALDMAAFDDLPDDLATMRTFLVDLVQGMSVPLPEEPVGLGARWRLRRSVRIMGLEVTAEDTFGPLTRTADKRPEAKLLARTSAEPQEVEGGMFGMPEGFHVRLLEWKQVGEATGGAVTLRLDALGFDGRGEGHTKVLLAGESEAVKVNIPVTMHTKTNVKFVPAAKKPAPK